MKGGRKIWTLGLTGMAIAAIIVLAVSLSNLKLRGAQPFSLGPVVQDRAGLEPPPASAGTVGVAIRALLIIAGVFLPFAIIYYIVSPEARRRVLRDLCFLLAVLLPVYLLMWARPAFLKNAGEVRLLETSPQDLRLPPKVEFSASPSRWLVLATNAALAVGLAAAFVGVGWFFWRRGRRSQTPLEQLAQEAEGAVEAIEGGADLGDTVMHCYAEMMRVLKEQRGIRRERAMTPREFEASLQEMGIPTEQIGRLTRLFEDVRYGDKRPGKREEGQAVASLTAIVEFCRSSS